MDRLIALLTADPAQLFGALLSQPLFSLAIAGVVAAAWLVVRRRGSASGVATTSVELDDAIRTRYRPERVALRIAAVTVIVALGVENLTATVLPPDGDTVSWWRYAAPALAGAITLVALLLVITLRGSAAPRRPVPLAGHRTWASFGTRGDLYGAALATLALALTTIAAGLLSSPDPKGRYVWLEVPILNTSVDPLRPWFFGWACGVPVLLSAAALLAITVAALRCNAMRPFVAPETLRLERLQRSTVASGILRISTASVLLSLAAAWRFIAESGTTTGLSIEGVGTYEVAWRYAELAAAAGWAAPLVEVVAFLLLFFCTGIRAPRRRTSEPGRDEVGEPLLVLSEGDR